MKVFVILANFLFTLCLASNLRSDIFYGQEVNKNWSRELGEAFRDLAGLGYVTKESALEQLDEIDKIEKGYDSFDKTKVGNLFRNLFQNQKWEHIMTYTGDESTYNYCFTVIRNKKMKKVVFAFSGTKGIKQLSSELWKTNGVAYFRDPSSKVKVMKYFQDLYQTINAEFFEGLDKAKDESIEQYIFVGHSLGGAMASLALYDSVLQGKIVSTEKSPVLISYGQPRTGNYVFSNEIAKMAPIIFRHVNNYDIIVGASYCYSEQGNCINEYNKPEIDINFSDYDNKDPQYKMSYYPWHLPGFILNYGDQETNPDCAVYSESRNPDCSYEISFSIRYHSYYYGYKISAMCKPELFPYEPENDLCDYSEPEDVLLTMPGDRDIWDEDEFENVKNKVKQSLCRAYLWGSKAVNSVFSKILVNS